MAALHLKGIVQLQHLAHLGFNSATECTDRTRHKGKTTMAYVNSTSTTHGSFSDRFARLVKDLRVAMERRRVYNRTVRELSALSSRELADLGLSRTMITRVAIEAAYGK
jgi:uncharacterized protein YjiS (DUF1127 family)